MYAMYFGTSNADPAKENTWNHKFCCLMRKESMSEYGTEEAKRNLREVERKMGSDKVETQKLSTHCTTSYRKYTHRVEFFDPNSGSSLLTLIVCFAFTISLQRATIVVKLQHIIPITFQSVIIASCEGQIDL
jgi:hypothetical protein